ncbi:MAG: TolC family protein [Cyclobacteriaceae bacterium]|jgi:outer membrane protein|nr:TolC family protein [Cyclobacteriaceae bacterium]
MNRYLVLIILLASSIVAQSQDTLSLARAIQIGLQNNFDVRIEKLNVDIARNNNNWGQAGMFPTINLTGGQPNSVVQRKPANPFAVAGKNVSDNINGQLDAQFTLFDGFFVRLSKARLENLEELSGGNARFVMENIIQAIILGYYQVLLQQEQLNVLIKNKEFSKERYDYIKLRKELGGAITFDVLQEQNNYLTDSASVLQQEIFLKNSIRNLNLLMSENINKTYRLTDPIPFESESFRYEDLRDKMTSSNTNLKNQYLSQELFRNATRLAESNYSPTITLNVGATGSLDRLNANFRAPTGNVIQTTVGYVNGDLGFPVYNNVNETALTRMTQTGNSYGAYANFGLRFTIFNGGQIRRAVENARIQETMAQLSTDQLKLSLENDLLASFDLYNLRQQLVQIAQVRLQAAELNLTLADERYKNGALSAIDLRIVQDNYQQAALETYLAIFARISSQVDLVRLTGGLVDNPRP